MASNLYQLKFVENVFFESQSDHVFKLTGNKSPTTMRLIMLLLQVNSYIWFSLTKISSFNFAGGLMLNQSHSLFTTALYCSLYSLVDVTVADCLKSFTYFQLQWYETNTELTNWVKFSLLRGCILAAHSLAKCTFYYLPVGKRLSSIYRFLCNLIWWL